MTSVRHRALAIGLASGFGAGCAGPKPASSSETTPGKPTVSAKSAPVAAKTAPKAPATNRKANHKGVTFVAEWHHIAVGKTTMHRSPAAFRADLERLDKMGFRPVTAKDWLAGKMALPKGASPVVLTFDDSDADQLRLRDDGSVDPKCGVGVWLDFAKTHPEFPVKGTFFVLPNLWSQRKWVAKKLEMLRGWGSEIANHTITHVPLRKQTDARVEQELGEASLALAKLGEKGPFDLAYPYGSTPKNLGLLKGFPYKSGTITIASGFLAGSNPADTPPKDLYRIPRIQATPGDYGLGFWLDEVAKGKVKVYVE